MQHHFIAFLLASSLLSVAVADNRYGGGSGWSGYGPPQSAPVAHIRNGTVNGIHSDTYNQDFFLGVPYAQPPANELRFSTPRSINTSFNTIVANQYAPSCVGYGGDDIGYPTSEDCLYLNVIRPSGYDRQALPIGLWIHGGGLVMGGSRGKSARALTYIC